jgi:hypothetical protein
MKLNKKKDIFKKIFKRHYSEPARKSGRSFPILLYSESYVSYESSKGISEKTQIDQMKKEAFDQNIRKKNTEEDEKNLEENEMIKEGIMKMDNDQKALEDKLRREKNFIAKEVNKVIGDHKNYEEEGKEEQTKQEMNIVRKIFAKVAVSKIFHSIINVSIVFNTIVLAMDRHPINDKELTILEMINIGFYCIFLIEMIIKLIGMGVKGYIRDKFNIFD